VITKILHSDSGHNTIFDLDVTGAAVKAMIVDWQHEPIKGALLHIDLKRIAMDKAMRVSVPIQLTGVPVGVKTQGGILEHVLREVEIECLPGDIPSHLDVDVSGWSCMAGDPRLRPAALGLDQVPGRRGRDGRARDRDPRRGCRAEERSAAAPAEPEVAKKGKGDAEAAPAADAKDAKKK
jgi:large subunit ribosomal protein L25